MLNLLIPIITTLLDKVLPDPKVASEVKFKIIELAQNGELAKLDADIKLALAQTEINKVEASTDMFRGGWRPFIGWVCGFGFLAQVVFAPVVVGVSSIIGKPIVFPPLDVSVLLTMLGAATGMGVMRTTEKLKGIK